MPPEIKVHEGFDSGTVYKFRGNAVFVPAGIVEQIGTNIESEEDAVWAADSPHQDTPLGTVVFEGNGREATDRAALWATIHERVGIEPPLAWRESGSDPCERVRVPAVVAADGHAAMAAFLACYGFDNGEIANAIGVGQRTVSQYISDFRKGER